MDMMKLKITTPAYVGYSGQLGPVIFKDGVSTEPLPRHIRDRMATSFDFLEIDKDGNEQIAGVQHRMIRDAAILSQELEVLGRQTEDEKKRELAADAIKDAPKLDIQTREQLEEIASKGGIKALREVGNKWNVKHRAIPTLIEMILDAQAKALGDRQVDEVAADTSEDQDEEQGADQSNDQTGDQGGDGQDDEDQDETEVEQDNHPDEDEALRLAREEEEAEMAALQDSAASGDLSAAINAATADEEKGQDQ